MRIAGFILSAAMILFLMVMAPAYGQQRLRAACLPYDKMGLALEKHGETRAGFGIHSTGRWRIELWVSDEGSWSILVVDTQGNACMASDGVEWERNIPDPMGMAPEASPFEPD